MVLKPRLVCAVILMSFVIEPLWLNPVYSQPARLSNTTSSDEPIVVGSASVANTLSLYPNIITAVGAVAGAIAGTYMSGKNVRDLERQKINKQEQQEQEINIRLRRAIYGELLHLSDKLANLIRYSDSDTFAEASISIR
jgi:hypothetical protein